MPIEATKAAITRDPILIDLALQGGGSHGAFTWGVLDRLLEESWLRIDGISGTSAGAMNAAVLVDGYAYGSLSMTAYTLDLPCHVDDGGPDATRWRRRRVAAPAALPAPLPAAPPASASAGSPPPDLPTDAEIAHALKVVEATRDADARGVGAYVVDGKMIDIPFVTRACAIVASARSLGLLPG